MLIFPHKSCSYNNNSNTNTSLTEEKRWLFQFSRAILYIIAMSALKFTSAYSTERIILFTEISTNRDDGPAAGELEENNPAKCKILLRPNQTEVTVVLMLQTTGVLQVNSFIGQRRSKKNETKHRKLSAVTVIH